MRALLSRLLLMLMMAPVLWGCGGAPSFSSLIADNSFPAPPVSLAALDGLPPEAAGAFAQAMRAAAQKRGIRLVQGDFTQGQGIRLTGMFGSVPDAEGVRVSHFWRMSDEKGRELMQFSGAEAGAGAGAYPAELLARSAETVAEAVSSRLSQLGYSARAAGIPPPPEAFQMAGPGAEKDVDYETMLGPGMTVAGDPLSPMPAPAAPAAAPEPEKTAAKASGPAIKAVALPPVTGAGEKGNAELRAALKKILLGGGWPVVDAPRPDALTISGKVEIAAPKGASQRVSLAWTVSKPDGTEAGTVRQANDVPAGSLDAGWGETAQYAAQAAAEGIADLVQHLR